MTACHLLAAFPRGLLPPNPWRSMAPPENCVLSLPELVVTGSSGVQVRGPNRFGRKMSYKELLIPLENR